MVILTAAAVASYYWVPAVHGALDELARFRDRWGFAYSAISTSVMAGVLPFLYLHFNPQTRAAHPWPHLAFLVIFWAYKGAEVDALYRAQAYVFGATPTAPTVLAKMLVDQMVYNGLYAAPLAVLIYAWKDAGFRWAGPLADLQTPRWYVRRVLPVLLAVWAVWVPAVCCIYALPLSLQLPIASLLNCFWVILFSLITTRSARS